ncbi:glycosyltransferase family 4 protein [Clostridium tertium]
MKIAVVTSIKAPYRTLQLEEVCRNKSIDMSVYYTKRGKEDRDWEVNNTNIFKEIYLENIKAFDKYGTLNKGLKEIVKNNDIIFIGGYDKPTYIILSLLCRFYKKPYVIIFDGISCDRLTTKENILKKLIKNLVIKHSSAIWGNGTVSRRYFNEVFNYPVEKIYNQYLTIDGERIKSIGEDKDYIRKKLRVKYGIAEDEKVLQYSGRIVDVKNLKVVVEAISKIKDSKITLFITGGGIQEEELKILAKELSVKLIITGFINNQDELFTNYYVSDVFILPSRYEPWGLVVNEAMFAGLPILVSHLCGCSLDFIKSNNGYVINPFSIEDIEYKIKMIVSECDLISMGRSSKEIIGEYSFVNSSKSFNNIINSL